MNLGFALPLIAIDPGRRIGWALAHGGVIVDCGTTGDYHALPWASVAVIEMPRVYPNPMKWKGDPQQIVRLAALAGRIAERYPFAALPEPRRWRGMAPERVIRARTLRALQPGEFALTARKLSVHAWDALGIACWALGRFR